MRILRRMFRISGVSLQRVVGVLPILIVAARQLLETSRVHNRAKLISKFHEETAKEVHVQQKARSEPELLCTTSGKSVYGPARSGHWESCQCHISAFIFADAGHG